MKFFDKIVELINWLKIFLSPVVISLFLAFLVLRYGIDNYRTQFFAAFIIVAGIVVGVYFAEKMRKKYGAEKFMSKIYASPDLDDVKKND